MLPPMPPLSAIRVFEAAARHGNFTRAAEELGMSQASVSYQIKVLEERLGTVLFFRQHRKVELTSEGRRLAEPTIRAFEQLRVTYATAAPDQVRTLSVSATPSFAANWLSARIGRFQLDQPGLAVRVDAAEENVDFARQDVDVAIRYGRGGWPRLTAHRLIDSEFTPMLSPTLLARSGGLDSPADLLRLRILDPTDPYWGIWLEEAGVADHDLACRTGSRLSSQSMEAQAAMAGHGVAMLTPRFVRHELETGRLVQPFAQVSRDGMAHWLVYPEARRNVKSIRAFRKWICAAVRDDPDAG